MSNEWLVERLSEYGNREAVVRNDQSYSYHDLLQEYCRWKDFLTDQKVLQGEVVVIDSDFSLKAVSLLMALIENKNMIVPLANSNPEYYHEYLNITQADKVIKVNDSDIDIQTIDHIKTNVLLINFRKKNEPGLILFTSGSSGKPKAVLHSFSKLLMKYHEKQKQYRTLLFLLFDHIGGINTLFYTLANGGTLIQAKGKDIHTICSQIEKNRVELLPTTPTFLTLLLLGEAYQNYDLSSLKLITYGTEPIQESLLNKLNMVLPGVRFKQTYGTSELGILRLRSRSSNSVWIKFDADKYDIKVVDDTLYIKTDTAMEGYLNAPTPFDEEGWYNTQDKVVIDDDYIRILGRESDIINVGGFKVFPAEIEDLILQMSGIINAVVFGERNPITGNIVAMKVNVSTNEDEITLKRRVREFCKDKLKSFMIPAKIYIVDTELYNTRFKKMRN
jgi:long-chain acyl-CoA synthetase